MCLFLNSFSISLQNRQSCDTCLSSRWKKLIQLLNVSISIISPLETENIQLWCKIYEQAKRIAICIIDDTFPSVIVSSIYSEANASELIDDTEEMFILCRCLDDIEKKYTYITGHYACSWWNRYGYPKQKCEAELFSCNYVNPSISTHPWKYMLYACEYSSTSDNDALHLQIIYVKLFTYYKFRKCSFSSNR